MLGLPCRRPGFDLSYGRDAESLRNRAIDPGQRRTGVQEGQSRRALWDRCPLFGLQLGDAGRDADLYGKTAPT